MSRVDQFQVGVDFCIIIASQECTYYMGIVSGRILYNRIGIDKTNCFLADVGTGRTRETKRM